MGKRKAAAIPIIEDEPREDLHLESEPPSDSEKPIEPEKADQSESEVADQEMLNEKLTDSQGIGAPALISSRMKSDLPLPPESQDIEYLTQDEVNFGAQIHTIDTMLIEDADAGEDHMGPFIERCVGRNPESHKLMVVRVRAKTIKVMPYQIMQYLGNVVQDHQAVHTGNVLFKKRRWGYSFDHFYKFNGKLQPRCCLVLDKVHQAALLHEKMVDRKSRKAFSRIRQIKGPLGQSTGNPQYKVLGVKEDYYRELKKIFEKYFLKRGDESLAEDIGLKILIADS